MIQVDVDHITARLTHFDASYQYLRTRATQIRYNGGGGSEAFYCWAEDGHTYYLKAQNNGQDRGKQTRIKILTSELICARLGRLFAQPICPEGIIIDLPQDVSIQDKSPSDFYPQPGWSFGSRQDPMAQGDVGKNWHQFSSYPPEQLARLIVFHTWLRGSDVQALHTINGSFISIDHGYYLPSDNEWNEQLLDENPPSVTITTFPDFEPTRFHYPQQMKSALQEVQSIAEDDIIMACSDIPLEWGADVDFKRCLALYILRRRQLLEQTLHPLCN